MNVKHDTFPDYMKIIEVIIDEYKTETILKALHQLADALAGLGNIYVNDLYLKLPSASTDQSAALTAVYWKKDPKHIRDEEDYKALSDEDHVSPLPKSLVSFGSEDSPLKGLEIRNPVGDDQDSIPLLLRSTAQQITKVSGAEVLDVIFHEYNDDDGVDHPYLRVYVLQE